MTKTFDSFCEKILGETIINTATNTTPQSGAQTPQQGQPNQAAPQQNQQVYKANPANSQQADKEFLQQLQQRMADQKFKDQLMQMLKNPQANATNKPA